MKWDSTEAPLTTTVDDPDAYSGHMDDKPVELSTENTSVHVSPPESVTVSMSPAEAYHLVDDLQAAADACWGAAEYVVTAHTDDGQVYVGTMKTPSEADAVRRVKKLLDERADHGELETKADFRRHEAANNANRFTVYRADSGTLVTPDELTDDDTNDN